MEYFVEFCRSTMAVIVEKKHEVRLALGVILTFFLVWMIYDTLVGTITVSGAEKAIEVNVGKLKDMEAQSPPNIKVMSKTEENQMKVSKEEVFGEETELPDEKAEEQKIMSMEDPDIGVFNQWFDDCAILGDSLAEGAGEFGFLNSSILFAGIGCSVVGAGDLVESMVQMYPEKIFLAFGVNDMEIYGTNVERFIEHYQEMISDIRKRVPEAEIYVSAILPVQQKAIDKEPKRKNVGLYNEKLEAMCDGEEVTFLNPGFILEQDDSLYEPDGIHAVKKFYYKWLTYLADMAGASQ